MELYYEGSDGTKLDLMNYPIFAQSPETLTQSSWEYTSISGINGAGRIKLFYKDAQECNLTLSIMADDAESFNKTMYEIHKIFDRDVRRLTPGRLWWNGFYKEVFAVDMQTDDFEELFESAERTITFISVYPYWIRNVVFSYTNGASATDLLDYNDFDYDIDYDLDDTVEVINNDCIDAATFEIKFYGPCINPTISIGNHEYTLLETLEAGEYATVNARTKKIYKYLANGERENIFHLRDRDSYIFQPIPYGSQTLIRSKSLTVDVTIFDERGEPEWI